MTRFARGLLLGAAVVASYAPLACSDEHGHGSTGPTDAIYAGTATDEGLAVFDGATSTPDAAKAPALTAPAAGSKVPAATPVKLTWKASPTAFPTPTRAPRYEGSSPFGAMRAAHAHGTPMNGRAYLLTFKSGGNRIARVFTTNTEFTPDDATWTKLKQAKSIEVVLATAQYDQNNIVPGSGPFEAPGVAFTIE